MILYFHGFNSAAKERSDKLDSIAELDEVRTVTYDTFLSADKIEPFLVREVMSMSETVKGLIGTSLGGYWAARIGTLLSIPFVACNPACVPAESLQQFVGLKLENFVTGEERVLSQAVLDGYAHMKAGGRGMILLDAGDELLDSLETKRRYERDCPVTMFPGGSHRFEHMEEALDVIRDHFGYSN